MGTQVIGFPDIGVQLNIEGTKVGIRFLPNFIYLAIISGSQTL